MTNTFNPNLPPMTDIEQDEKNDATLDRSTKTLVNDIRDNDHTKEFISESIIASAVRGSNNRWNKSHPVYETSIFIGKRHCHALAEMNYYWYECLNPREDQWFLSSKNRYVNREQWMIIAREFWQTDKQGDLLYSEDLW